MPAVLLDCLHARCSFAHLRVFLDVSFGKAFSTIVIIILTIIIEILVANSFNNLSMSKSI